MSGLPSILHNVTFSVSSADSARSSGRTAPGGELPPSPGATSLRADRDRELLLNAGLCPAEIGRIIDGRSA